MQRAWLLVLLTSLPSKARAGVVKSTYASGAGAFTGRHTLSRNGSGVFEPWLQEFWEANGHPNDWLTWRRAGEPWDLRVTKGLGPKGYRKVRVSLIAPQLQTPPDFNFTYRSQFRHRWTENFLHSVLLNMSPGANELTIGGQRIVVDLPAENEGVRGVVWSDPCFSSRWINCAYGQRFSTFHHGHQMLNAVFRDPSMTFFAILGDNFYDQTGELTKTFFSQLSPDVKRRFVMAVNGNHDNWVCGSPRCGDRYDSYGIGQMQYYAMDAVSSTLAPQDDANFLSFAVDPDEQRRWGDFQNDASNFLVYHKLGNLGFLAFTGAASYAESEPHFREACEYFAEARPDAVFLLGHWNSPGDGCPGNMTTPAVRAELLKIPACAGFGERLKYLDGHEHCNFVQAAGPASAYGFAIGAHGMDDVACGPQYGFLYVDSTGQRLALHYFEVDSEERGSRFEEILECVRSRGGLHACTGLADTWLDEPLSAGRAGDASLAV